MATGVPKTGREAVLAFCADGELVDQWEKLLTASPDACEAVAKMGRSDAQRVVDSALARDRRAQEAKERLAALPDQVIEDAGRRTPSRDLLLTIEHNAVQRAFGLDVRTELPPPDPEDPIAVAAHAMGTLFLSDQWESAGGRTLAEAAKVRLELVSHFESRLRAGQVRSAAVKGGLEEPIEIPQAQWLFLTLDLQASAALPTDAAAGVDPIGPLVFTVAEWAPGDAAAAPGTRVPTGPQLRDFILEIAERPQGERPRKDAAFAEAKSRWSDLERDPFDESWRLHASEEMKAPGRPAKTR